MSQRVRQLTVSLRGLCSNSCCGFPQRWTMAWKCKSHTSSFLSQGVLSQQRSEIKEQTYKTSFLEGRRENLGLPPSLRIMRRPLSRSQTGKGPRAAEGISNDSWCQPTQVGSFPEILSGWVMALLVCCDFAPHPGAWEWGAVHSVPV